ncbi:cytochrome P450 [Streptosporangiaceae bacterium NEAU-GS5]|nr:cytochrome P450 [Streptosporangiaceae bacterium NEAU-GS5]
MSTLPQLPFARRDVLDIPPEFRELRERARVTKVRTETGDEAWLVTGYEEARRILADDRLGRSHPTPESAPRITNNAMLGGPIGDHATERATHQAMRRLLAPAFSARRMQRLSGRVQGLVDDLLDELEAAGPPADLHERFSVPLPVQVICELLGVPYEDRDSFRRMADAMTDTRDSARSAAAQTELGVYTHTIVQAKRADPGEDIYSDLARAELPPVEVARIAAGLLFAGHETTVNRIDTGLLCLLRDRTQYDALAKDAALAPGAVEEILRLASSTDTSLLRYAHEDVEIAGVTIKAGDAVSVSVIAANRDEEVFEDAERFDIGREAYDQHLGFGYAMRYCLGASLARVELRAVFSTLPRRFPTLELAVPREELTRRADRVTGGFRELPVVW